MNCSDVHHLIVGHLDGELPERTSSAVAAHLSDCAVCRRQAAELTGTWEFLDDLEAPRAGPDFGAAVREKLAARRASPRPWFAAAAAACLLLAVGLFFLLPDGGDPASEEGQTVAGADVVRRRPGDEELIRDLEVYENLDLLLNIEVIGNLDALEAMAEAPR